MSSNEDAFASYKGHFFVAGSRWEKRMPELHHVEQIATIELAGCRDLRRIAYEEMRDKVGLTAIHLRNLQEFGDPLGPTKEYFVRPADEPGSTDWAYRVLNRIVQLNGRAALAKLAETRKEALASDDLLPPKVKPLATKHLRFVRTGDALKPWVAREGSLEYEVRLNAFPDEMFYSLLVDGVNWGDFNDWPAHWKREPLP